MTPFAAAQLAAIDSALTARIDQQAIDDDARMARIEALPSFPALRVAVSSLESLARRARLSPTRTRILSACGSLSRPRWIGGFAVLKMDLWHAARGQDDAATSTAIRAVFDALRHVEADLASATGTRDKRTTVEATQPIHASA